MANKTYRVGIVGLSGIASGAPLPPGPRAAWQGRKLGPPFAREIVVSHTACLDLVPRTEIVGYCDVVPEMLNQYKESWGARWPDAKAYSDYKEMLAREDLDILTVTTGDNRHADIAVDGANAGVKAIFVEKPLATSMEDANRMLKACEDNGIPISVGHTRAWDPHYHKVRDMIRAGEIGPLSTIVVNQGGKRAMLFRNGTHILHGVCFFADAPPRQVFAELEEGFDHWDEYRGDGGKKPENEPSASGYIHFSNGVRAFYNSDKNSPLGSTIQLTGTKGQITFGLTDGWGTLVSLDPETGEAVSRTIAPLGLASNYQVMGYVAAYEELIGLIEKGEGRSVGSGHQARWVVQIMTGFLKSNQAGGALVDVPE